VPRNRIVGRGFAFSPDGRTLAACGEDGQTIRLLDVRTGEELAAIREEDGTRRVAFSPDGRTLAWGAGRRLDLFKRTDSTIKLWDLKAGRVRHVLRGHKRFIAAIAFSPDGKTLASSSTGEDGHYPSGGVRLWDVQTGREKKPLEGGQFMHGHRLLFFPDRKTLVACELVGGQTATLWDLETLKKKADFGHELTSPTISPDGRTLAAVSIRDGVVKRWDLRTGKEVAPFNIRAGALQRVAYSPDGKTLATRENEPVPAVRLWDVVTGAEKVKIQGVRGGGLAFSPDGRTIAIGCGYVWGRVGLFDARTGEEQGVLSREPTWSVAYSPDGKTLAAATGGGMVRLFDTASGRQIAALEGHTGPARCVAYSHDGKLLASAEQDTPVRLRDLNTGKEKIVLTRQIAYSPDVWDVRTGKKSRTLKGHAFEIRALAVSPDGKTLASASVGTDEGGPPDGAGELLLWDVSPSD
jgi:WD40 repeat protein